MGIGAYFLDALSQLATPTGIIFLIVGAFAGMVLGAIPGLGGGTLMILLLPICYKLDPVMAMALFTAIYVGGICGGCIGSILLGIPGTAASLCASWDGYAFTKRGDPVRPLSNAVICNFLGTVPSIILAIFACRIIAKWAVGLGPWEYAALCFAAIAMVVGLSDCNVVKGMIAVALAFLLATIGADPINATKRFTFGIIDLYGGFNIVNVMLGMFAAKIIAVEYARRSKIDMSKKIKVGRFRFPGQDLAAHWGAVVRSWITGAVVGFLPGLGGPAASVIAYSNEKNLAKDRDNWGSEIGSITGVMASETANNATIGGAMIPMIALGIPGDAAMVQFLAILNIHGINAGPILMQNNPSIVYMIFTAGILAGVFCLITQIVSMPIFPALLKIPYHFLYPAIIVICFLGAYMTTGTLYGLIVTVGFCILGLFMDHFDIPTTPFVMAFILAGMLEKNIRQAMNYSSIGVGEFFTRPISCIFILIGVVVLIWNLIAPSIREKKKKAAKGSEE